MNPRMQNPRVHYHMYTGTCSYANSAHTHSHPPRCPRRSSLHTHPHTPTHTTQLPTHKHTTPVLPQLGQRVGVGRGGSQPGVLDGDSPQNWPPKPAGWWPHPQVRYTPLRFPATHPAARTPGQGPGPAAGVGCSPAKGMWGCAVSGASPLKLSLLVCKTRTRASPPTYGCWGRVRKAHGPLALEPGFPGP